MSEKRKITKKQIIGVLQNIVEGVEDWDTDEIKEAVFNYLTNEEKALNTKRVTQAQKDNAILKEVVYDILKKQENPITVSDLLKVDGIAAAGIVTSQKLSAVLKVLREEETPRVEKVDEGRKPTFRAI